MGVAIGCLPATALAQARTESYVDLQGGLGYSTNPLLVLGDNTGSAFARVSAFGFWGRTTQRSSTSLSAYVENSTYFQRYSNKQIFSLAARTERAVNERIRVFGDLGFSGDFGGMLSSRLYGVPSTPVIPDPTIPASFVVADPDLYNLSSRQYRISGQVGASAALSARDSVTAAVGAQRVLTGGNGNSLDFNTFDGSVGYERILNERLTVGARVVAQYTDYSNGSSVTTIGPQATVRAQLSEQWEASVAAGFVRTKQHLADGFDDQSTIDLALDGSLCRNAEFERICARVARRSQASVVGGSSTDTSAGLDYYRRLSDRDTVQVTTSWVRASGLRTAFVDQSSQFLTASASYDRKLNDRLAAGANVAARRLTRIGPDPKSDIGGSVFVRYRLGKIR